MISSLLAALTKDVLSIVRTGEFFALSLEGRREKIEQDAGLSYPTALSAYLTNVSEQVFVEDMKSLSSSLAAGKESMGSFLVPVRTGLYPVKNDSPTQDGLSAEFWSDIQALLTTIEASGDQEVRSNTFVDAVRMVFAEEIADVIDLEAVSSKFIGPETAAFLEAAFRTGRGEALTRGLQVFLREQGEGVSPVIQSPSPLSPNEKRSFRTFLRERYPGSFTVFEVEPSLGGGIRLFVNGTLFDESWMTQVAHLLTTMTVG
jgi:F0F1-type ATP synthase delta subunit